MATEFAGTASPLRICLMVPANNTTMERELLAHLPAGSTCRTLKIPRGAGLLTRDTVPAYRAAALDVARTLDEAVDGIAYGCTAAGFISGPRADADLARDLSVLHGVPVVTTASAMVDELLAIEARRAGLVTPYSDETNAGLVSFLQDAGIAAAQIARLHAPDVQALGRVTASDVDRAARSLRTDGLDAAFIACSQLPTAEILAPLRAALGIPFLSSIQATAAQILARLSIARAPGYAGHPQGQRHDL